LRSLYVTKVGKEGGDDQSVVESGLAVNEMKIDFCIEIFLAKMDEIETL
jgi:hypothetical protein